jgi:thiamine transporter
MKKNQTLILAECAIMLGLASVLSEIKIWKMPLEGSVTLLSMLPIVLISIKHGVGIGLPLAGLYSLIQVMLSKLVFFGWSLTATAVLGVFLLDYIIAFSVLGLAGAFRKKGLPGWVAGICIVMLLRFSSHFASGILIFGQWAPEGSTPFMHSLMYNGTYMLPELIFTLVGAVFLLKTPIIQRMFSPAVS